MPNHRQNYLMGLFLVALAATLFGVAGAVAKILFISKLSPVQLTAIRAFVAALVMFSLIVVVDRKSLMVTKKQFFFLFLLAIVWACVTVTFYLSVSKIDVAVALTLEYTAPIFVIVFGLFAGTHRFSFHVIWIIIISVVGCILLTEAYDSISLQTDLLGIIYGLLSGIAFAIYTLLGNKGHVLGIRSVTMTVYALGISAGLWLLAIPWLELSSISLDGPTIGYILFIAIGATVIPFWIYMAGLKHIDAFPATIVGMLDPISAGLAAYLLLGEVLSGWQMAGMLLVFYVIASVKLYESKFLTPA